MFTRLILKGRTARGLALAAALFMQAPVAWGQSLTAWQTPEYYASHALNQVNAAGAYALGFTGAGVLVATVDSGLDSRHPEFSGRVSNGYDFTNDVPILPNEDHDLGQETGSHGTHVAGIIGAARDGIGMQGVAFNATIVPTAYNENATDFDAAFSANWRYLAGLGVPIVNNSIGINDCVRRPNDPCNVTYYNRAQFESLYPNMVAAAKATAAADVLMVFATGNESQSSPDALGGMPYLIPELKNTWLTVAAVDANNVIASFSNRCGVAKDWCLSAPGVAINSTVTLGTGTGPYNGYADMSGTSMASPVVSGVAALVKEAFPWFTAHDLQQTLLTTATDLGAVGVDEIYGWGLVNAAKAVLGYGQFVETATLDTKGYSSTFSNDISGVGGLIKAGAGTLTLIGANTYAGGTTINGGTLQIGNGGTTGSIIGNVVDNGTLAFKRSDTVVFDGAISGTGSLTQAGTGTLILTATNTYTGGTLISAGTLQVGNGGTTGSIVGNVVDNGVLAFNRSDSFTFAGSISGTGSLVKAGAGTLTLTGNNSYTGLTSVTGGLLSVNGAFASTLAIGASGTLRGTGTLTGPLVVAGRLAPGNSPGTLTVAGPVTLTSTSTFQTDIDGTGTGTGAGNYSRLVTTGTTGTVTVAGTLAPVLRGITGSATNTYTPTLGTTFTVIQTSAGLSGSFSSLTQPVSGLPTSTRFDALYSSTSLALVVTPLWYGNLAANGLATTANASALGSAVDSIRPIAGIALTGTNAALFNSLYSLTPMALPAALSQMTGEVYASTAAQTFDDARQVRAAINERLDDATAAKPDKATAKLSSRLNVAVWATGYGGWGNASGDGLASLGWTQSGFIAGADVKVFDTTRLGIAAGFGQSAGNVDALNSKADNSHTDLALYGVSQLAGFIAKYGAAYSWNDITTSRNVAFGTFSNGLSSSYNGNTTQVFGEVSRPFTFGPAQVSPFAAVAYVNQSFDAFSETGGVAALSGSAMSMSTTLTTFGARVSTDMAVGNGIFTPSVKLGWQHAFGDVESGAVMWLNGSTPFLVAGTPIARDALALNVGLFYAFNDAVSAGFAYDGVLGSDAQSNTLKGNLRVNF